VVVAVVPAAIQATVATVALEEVLDLVHLSMLKMDPVVVVPAAIVTGGVVLSTLAEATVVVVLAFLARALMEQLIQHHLAQANRVGAALVDLVAALLIIL
jgi:hypothetical protein